MAYIGKAPNTAIVNQTTSQSFNGTGSATTFTLNRSVNVGEDLEVFVNNVQQEPGSGKSYTASGTTLTFDEAPPSGTGNVYVIYRGEATINPRLEHDANAALSATTGTFTGAFTSPGIDDNADATAITIDSSENVGFGTTTPSSFYSLADDIVVGTGSGGRGLTIYSGSSDSGYIGFNDTASASMQGFIQYNHNGDYMALAPNGSEKVRIASDGKVGIGTSSASVPFEVTTENAGFQAYLNNDNGSAQGLKIRIKANDSGDFAVFEGISASSGSDTTVFKIIDNGKVQIGTTATYATQNINANGSAIVHAQTNGHYRWNYQSSNQNMYWSNGSNQAYLSSGGAWTDASDVAYKKDITDATYGIDTVKALQPRFYYMKDDAIEDDSRQLGFIAQELEVHVPEVVTGSDGSKGVEYGHLTAVLTKALQEAVAKIETLEAKVAALEAG